MGSILRMARRPFRRRAVPWVLLARRKKHHVPDYAAFVTQATPAGNANAGPHLSLALPGASTTFEEIPMSLSSRLRMPILAAAAVLITTLGVVVPGSSATPTSQAHATSAAATTKGYTSHVIGTWGRHGT